MQTPLILFFSITFLIAWPAFFFASPQAPVGLQVFLLILGSYAPALGAWVANRFERDQGQSSAFRSRLTAWRAPLQLYAVAVGVPLAVWIIALLVRTLVGFALSVQYLALFTFPIIFITNWGEEAGWRGFLLPRLLANRSPFTAGLLVGLVWGAFHIPLYWQRPLFGFIFLLLALALSVFITWLFRASNESVLICTLFHAVFNTISQAVMPSQGGEGILTLTAGLMWIIVIRTWFKNRNQSLPIHP